MKKNKISESDLYNIIKKVLLEQEENVWNTDEKDFKFRLFKVFGGDSEKFAKYHNKVYDKIFIDGDLDLAESNIKVLPDNLEVKNDVYLDDCIKLKSLGNNFKVGQTLFLDESSIEELPDDIQIGESLFLRNAPIKKLPNNLTIPAKLLLSYCESLSYLPDNLKVGKKLVIRNTLIEYLPESLEVGGLIIVNDTPLVNNRDLIQKYEDKGYKIYIS